MEDSGSKTSDQEVDLLVIRCSCQMVEIPFFIEEVPKQAGTQELWEEDQRARPVPQPHPDPQGTQREGSLTALPSS